MAHLPNDRPENQSGPSSGSPTPRPRIRDLEEMDRKRKEDERRFDLRVKIIRVLLLLICGAAAAVVIVGWADLRPRLARAETGLAHLRSLTSLEVELCRRHTGDDPASQNLLAKLLEAEDQMSSGDLPARIQGYRDYHQFTRVLCSMVEELSRKQRHSLRAQLSTQLDDTEAEVKQGIREFNLISKDYNLAAQRFPGSIARALGLFPGQLPYLSK